ncbi:MAG TPA: M10 family metallopeptidase, partial [Chloroflexia bacterium]|nr:M10 family metallopeptidase [Chloroflexia bacterium]
MSTAQQAAVLSAFAEYAAVANLQFTPLSETLTQHADLRFALSDAPTSAWAYAPVINAEGGDVWFNPSSGLYNQLERGSYAYRSVVHEIGHALGLEHPHESGMPSASDAMPFTVMSYRSYVGGSTSGGYTNETWGYTQSLMMLDIAAVQHLYGANFATRSGDTVYSWSPATGQGFVDGVTQGAPGGNRIFQTVWDGGGIDTYDFSTYGTALTVSLEPGAWTTTSTAQLAKLGNGHYAPGTIANALLYQGDTRSLIENAVGGSAGDQLTGNVAANMLSGQGGDDTLTGGLGNDVLSGGPGSDTATYAGASTAYSWSQSIDGTWTVTGAEGVDLLTGIETLRFSDTAITMSPSAGSSASDTIPGQRSVTGNGAANTLTGSSEAEKLLGFAGNDTLYGLSGADILIGGMGSDKLYGGDGADQFEFNSVKEIGKGSGRDAIADFQRGVDTIDLHGIDADQTAGGNQQFTWVDKSDLDAAFAGREGELRFAKGTLMGDTNGDG